MSERRVSHYRVLEPLGRGGMGVVYEAEDTRLGRRVAIKFLDAALAGDGNAAARFLREARAASALEHASVCRVLDVGEQDGERYIVMERLVGRTLRSALAGGPLATPRVLALGSQLASALEAAHARGIVHRDVKPGNVFLTDGGGVKLTDFGLAKIVSLRGPEAASATTGNGEPERLTHAGGTLGTVGYMSPEQARGEEVDARSDLFSLGAVLYEAATGRPPFQGATDAVVHAALLGKDAVRPREINPEVSAALEDVLAKALEKDREMRYQTAADLRVDLQRAARLQPSAPAVGTTSTGRGPGRPLRALAMAAGLVLAGALAAWVAGRARDLQTPTFTQLTFRRGTLTSARFTPDGQTIVYSALWDGQPPEVFSHRLDQPASESLGLPPATLLSVSARSELAVLLAPAGELGTVWVGTLARVPLSGGAVRPVLEDVLDADWSPDGRELAVIRWREGEFQLEYPIGTVLLRPCPPTRLRVSPRGDRVAVLDDRDGVLVLDRTGAQVRLPVERHRQRLAWSPSGDALLVDAGASDASRTLRRVALSGSVTEVCSLAGTLVVQDVGRNGSVLIHHGFERWDVRARLPNAPIEREASVFANSAVAGLSSDGGRILLWHRGEGPPGFALLRSIVGGPTLRVGEGTPLGLSPDGRFVLLEESDGTASRLALVPTGAGEVTRVVTDGLERFAGAWHVDETRLGFHAAAPGSSLRSFIVAPPAGAPRAVTPEGTLVVPGELPGGDVVAVSSDGTVTVSSPEAGTRRTLPWRLPPRPFRVVIRTSGDGRFLFVREGSVPARVARIDLETGAAEDWLQLAPADATGVAHVWSEALTPDGRGYAYTHGFFIQDLFLVKDLPGWP